MQLVLKWTHDTHSHAFFFLLHCAQVRVKVLLQVKLLLFYKIFYTVVCVFYTKRNEIEHMLSTHNSLNSFSQKKVVVKIFFWWLCGTGWRQCWWRKWRGRGTRIAEDQKKSFCMVISSSSRHRLYCARSLQNVSPRTVQVLDVCLSSNRISRKLRHQML